MPFNDLDNLGKPRPEQAQPSTPVPKPDYLYPTNDHVYRALRKGVRVLGEPGASLTWGIDGNRALESLTSGIEGEKQTAGIIEEFVQTHHGSFAFHSLSWPESNGDTDHIIAYKNLIIVIDSKRWKGQRKYSITASGTILRGTVPFDEGKVHIGSALKSWRKRLPETLKVVGVVAVAQEKIFVVRDKNWYKAPYRLVEADKLPAYLNELATKHSKGKTSLATLLILGRLLVKPRKAEKLRF